jgi:hypothetical protein
MVMDYQGNSRKEKMEKLGKEVQGFIHWSRFQQRIQLRSC